jgi:hypothetical protein
MSRRRACCGEGGGGPPPLGGRWRRVADAWPAALRSTAEGKWSEVRCIPSHTHLTPHTHPALQQPGSLVNKRNVSGFSALCYAAWCGDEATLRLLLRHGADPRAANEQVFDPVSGGRPAKRGQTWAVRIALMRSARARAAAFAPHPPSRPLSRASHHLTCARRTSRPAPQVPTAAAGLHAAAHRGGAAQLRGKLRAAGALREPFLDGGFGCLLRQQAGRIAWQTRRAGGGAVRRAPLHARPRPPPRPPFSSHPPGARARLVTARRAAAARPPQRTQRARPPPRGGRGAARRRRAAAAGAAAGRAGGAHCGCA